MPVVSEILFRTGFEAAKVTKATKVIKAGWRSSLHEAKMTSSKLPSSDVGWLANHRLYQRKVGLADSLIKGKVYRWMSGWK